MKQISVVGSISMDLVVESDRRPSAGETVIGSAFHTVPGGKGANQAVAIARLGGNVEIALAPDSNVNRAQVCDENFTEFVRAWSGTPQHRPAPHHPGHARRRRRTRGRP